MQPIKPRLSKEYFPEIQGLRAVAVILVLLYHIWPTVLTGGYIGVDVFFVISGYLITKSLVVQAEKTGHVNLIEFYKKRILRLLPAALIVIAAIYFLTPVLFPIFTHTIQQKSLASIFYVQNWLLAEKATDYLQMHESASPLTHFWSLAIEEQFYFVWPIIILVMYKIRPHHPQKIQKNSLLFASIFILITSLGYSIYLSYVNSGYAYFSTFTRAWELSLGAILAVSSAKNLITDRLKPMLATTGLVAIITSAFMFDSSTYFPGYVALLPTIGTVLVILAGSNRGFFHEQKLLTTTSAQFVGNISYSLYLWHWPILVFYTSNFNKSISLSHGLGLMLASIAIAAISTYCIEHPVRKSKWLRSRPKTVVFGSFGIMLILSCIIILNNQLSSPSTDNGNYGSIENQLLTIRQDQPDVYNNGCHLGISATEPELCQYGNLNSDTKVILVGDSHAANWIPALEEIAIRNDWHFASMTKSGCPYSKVPTNVGKKPYLACDTWNEKAEAIIADYSPDIFIISQTSRHRSIPGGSAKNYPLYANSAINIMRAQVEAGAQVFAIATTPVMKEDIPECLARNLKEPERCDTSREVIANRFTLTDPLITAANTVEGATIIHPLQLICNEQVCPAIINGKIIWRDRHHLTATFSRSLADNLEVFLKN